MITLQNIVSMLVLLGFPGLILFYVRDRRKTKVEAVVLEGTAKHQIDMSSISAVEAHVAFVERAFEAERESMRRQIVELRGDLERAEALTERQRAELERVRAELERLRGQVEFLNGELATAMKRLDAAMDKESPTTNKKGPS